MRNKPPALTAESGGSLSAPGAPVTLPFPCCLQKFKAVHYARTCWWPQDSDVFPPWSRNAHVPPERLKLYQAPASLPLSRLIILQLGPGQGSPHPPLPLSSPNSRVRTSCANYALQPWSSPEFSRIWSLGTLGEKASHSPPKSLNPTSRLLIENKNVE